jgi:ferredoxin
LHTFNEVLKEIRMIMLYFSGTGNSKYIAELFCRYMSAGCYSIEEKLDFGQLITSEETIGVCYPVYGSRVPRIMREFAQKHIGFLKNKKIIIFCTQLIFSGDGARAFTDLFPHGFIEVIYAEHFFMPNNVINFFMLPLTNDRKIKKCIAKAEEKMKLVCGNLEKGIVKRRGFNIISQALGLAQGAFMPKIEKKALDSLVINNYCSQCRLCVGICPMHNLEYQNEKIGHKRNCTMCYRCVNRCPQKAITVFFHGKVKDQYRGLGL